MLMLKMFRGFMFLSYPYIFIFYLPIRHVDNNVGHIFNMQMLEYVCFFSGLLKLALLEKT